MDKYDVYSNPLVSRYATEEMSGLFSERRRIGYFRRLWLMLPKGRGRSDRIYPKSKSRK